MDLSTLGTRLAQCVWPFLAAAALANVLSATAKAVTWQGLLDGVRGVEGRLRRLDLVSPLLVGALVNAGLPARAGEVAKVVLARRRVRRRGGEVGIAQVAGSVAAEHLVSTLAWAGFAVVLVCALPLPAAVRAATGVVAVGCAGVVALAAWRPPPTRRPAGRWRRAASAVADAWGAGHEGLRALHRPRSLLVVSAAGAGQWVAQWAAIWLTLEATGLGYVGLAGAGMVMVTLTLAHAVPLLPGGVGTFQIGAMLPLTGVYGVDPAAALAFGLVLQLGETAVNVVLGLVYLAREGGARAGAPTGAVAVAPSRRTALRSAISRAARSAPAG